MGVWQRLLRNVVWNKGTTCLSVVGRVEYDAGLSVSARHGMTVDCRHASGKSQATRNVVELTEAATQRIRTLLERRKHPGQECEEYIRLGVKRRGCNGLAYTLNYDVEKKRFDEEIVTSDGVRLLIDAGAVMHVLGTRMDFVEDDVRSEFVFMNPNASGTCGCGESFTTAMDEFKKE